MTQRPPTTRSARPGARPAASGSAARSSSRSAAPRAGATAVRSEAAGEAPARSERGAAVLVSLGRRVQHIDSDSIQLLGVTLALVLIGLVMVLSSSSVEQFTAGNTISDKFVKQAVTAAIGLPLMLIAWRMPVRFWKRMAWPMIVGAIFVQMLVFTPLGYSVGENRAWISLGGFTLQPAELTKVALIVWCALIFERKRGKLGSLKELAVPLLPVVGAAFLLVLMGKDLGTLLVLGALVLGAMWFGGVPLRYLAGGLGIAVVGAIGVAVTSPIRVARLTSFFNGTCDYEGLCWQTSHGLYALAAGGVFGVGLGNSRAKWSWLPEADNDFIFAIIGEELGLLGALVVIGLFVWLAVILLRIVGKTDALFSKSVCGAALVWLTFQAFVNIGVVLGLLPVLGVPLPLVSSGGSALITTMLAIGIVLSVSRGAAAEQKGARA
ncbi:putative peptidoglycan glycosyltransferase FtsW [Pseudoclavibacter triregionum]|nr:putative peptidoglycan glycosyltransferase FtsW [Pseudoclavibacter triregionum]